MPLDYWYALFRKRWPVLALVFGIVFVVAAALAVRDYAHRSWVGTAQAIVTPAPPLTHKPSSAGQILASETYARLMARSISTVIVSRRASRDIARYLMGRGLSGMSTDTVQSAAAASASDGTVSITVTSSSKAYADAIAAGELVAATRWDARLLGPWAARHTDVRVIGSPHAVRSGAGHIALTFLVRLILGAVVALALALAWDYLDDSVRSPDDVERWLEAPVLARVT